jgi:hypothetical protein
MIKTFEEFVNENYTHRQDWTREEREQFRSFLTDGCGFARSDWRRMEEFISIGGYTFEEIMDIFNRLNVINHTTMDMLNYLKELFDIDSDINTIKRKQEILDIISKEYNNKPVPVVVDMNGKLLTGIVYYCEQFGEYSKYEEDFYERGDEWLNSLADEEGIIDDDRPDWVDNHWDMLDVREVDLDKEFGWVEK